MEGEGEDADEDEFETLPSSHVAPPKKRARAAPPRRARDTKVSYVDDGDDDGDGDGGDWLRKIPKPYSIMEALMKKHGYSAEVLSVKAADYGNATNKETMLVLFTKQA